MSGNVMLLNGIYRQLLAFNERSVNIQGVRLVTKSPGQSQKGNKRPPKHFKLLAIPGLKVDERAILGKQKSLKYHPGYNVGLDPKNKNLYALVSGTVFYSIEKFNPNPNNTFVEQCYSHKVGPIYKKYIHVIKDHNPIHFKMTDLI